ncbi:hypothetical protein [Spirosoma fluminis]
MELALESITPQVATAMLEGNHSNRPFRKRHVKFLADQILAGAWQVTGDPIKVSTSGRLLDGQHRLMAIVQSNQTVSLFVARNCPDEIFSVLDTGAMRSAGDVLATAGMKSHAALAATAKLLIYHQRGVMAQLNNVGRQTTNAQILEFASANHLDPAVTVGYRMAGRSKLLNVSEWSALYYLLGKHSEEDALGFLHQLSTGINLTEGHPILLLRQKLESARDGRFNFTAAERLALAIKAWNAHRQNKKIGQLTWRISENFPEILP